MKKNNTYLLNHEIDLGHFVRLFWREKILILSISIICSLIGYIFTPSKHQEFITEITLKDPPTQIFEPYMLETINALTINNINNNIKNNSNDIVAQYILDFKLNFLSTKHLEIFLEHSSEFYNFKDFLKLKNINVNRYFDGNRFGLVKEKNAVIPNKFFLVFPKELDGVVFLNNYTDFIKKKTIIELKNNLKLTIQNKINDNEQALEIASIIGLEDPILKSAKKNQLLPEVEDLFYKGSKVLSQNIINLKKLLIKLENDPFNYDPKLDRSAISEFNSKRLTFDYFSGLILGFILSCLIIFFRSSIRNN